MSPANSFGFMDGGIDMVGENCKFFEGSQLWDKLMLPEEVKKSLKAGLN